MKTKAERRQRELEQAALERRLKRAVAAHQRDEERSRASYEVVLDEMRAVSTEGLSYERIAAVAGLSKTHVSRILRG